MLVDDLLKTKKEFKNFRGDTKYIHRNEWDKANFQHDMANGDFKDLARREVSDKVLRNKAFNIAKNPKCDGYQRSLAAMVYNFFYKKTSGSGVNNEIKQNEQLAEELHKPIIKKLKKEEFILHLKTIFGVLI